MSVRIICWVSVRIAERGQGISCPRFFVEGRAAKRAGNPALSVFDCSLRGRSGLLGSLCGLDGEEPGPARFFRSLYPRRNTMSAYRSMAASNAASVNSPHLALPVLKGLSAGNIRRKREISQTGDIFFNSDFRGSKFGLSLLGKLCYNKDNVTSPGGPILSNKGRSQMSVGAAKEHRHEKNSGY